MARLRSLNMWADLALKMNGLYWDSAFVMARRTGEMARGTMSADEWQRMVSEKPFAFLSALQSGSGAMLMGAHPAHVAGSAIYQVGKKAKANARRLKRK